MYLKGVTVAMADDSTQQLQRNKAVCVKYGMNVIGVFDNGESLIQAITKGLKPVVILLDIIMRGMTGVEVALTLRKSGYLGKIVLVTSMGQKSVSDPKRVGADYLLIKPFPDEWFLTAILEVIKDEPVPEGIEHPETRPVFPYRPPEIPEFSVATPKPSIYVNVGAGQIYEPPPNANPSELVITSGTAGGTLSGDRAVVEYQGFIVYADSTNINLINLPVSIITAAYAAAAEVTSVVFGYVIEPTWNWQPGLPLYLSRNGFITQVVPTPANGDLYNTQVGLAVNATTILWHPRSPIILTT
jgi:two-component system chemotaxis response regulator CheY